MLDWHAAGLARLDQSWLLSAALHVNQKLVGQPGLSALAALTRLDVSKNRLTNLPPVVMRLPSLRILNASHNLIEGLDVAGPWLLPVLEEVYCRKHIRVSII